MGPDHQVNKNMSRYPNTEDFLECIQSLTNYEWEEIRNLSIHKCCDRTSWSILTNKVHGSIFHPARGRFSIQGEMSYLCDRMHRCYTEKSKELRGKAEVAPPIDKHWEDFVNNISEDPLIYTQVRFQQDICILSLSWKRDPIFKKYTSDVSKLLEELQSIDEAVYPLTSEFAEVAKYNGFDGILYTSNRNPKGGIIMGECLALYNKSIEYEIL